MILPYKICKPQKSLNTYIMENIHVHIKVYNFWTKIKLPLRSSFNPPNNLWAYISRRVVARLIFSNFWFYSPSKSTSLVTINDCVYMGLNSHQWREGIPKRIHQWVWGLASSSLLSMSSISPINLHNCQFGDPMSYF